MYSACRRLTNALFDKAPARQFFGDFINFSDPFFFISIFAAFAIQIKFSFSCDGITLLNHDEFGKTEYIALRDFAKSLRELENIFFQKSVFTRHCRVNYLVYFVF